MLHIDWELVHYEVKLATEKGIFIFYTEEALLKFIEQHEDIIVNVRQISNAYISE